MIDILILGMLILIFLLIIFRVQVIRPDTTAFHLPKGWRIFYGRDDR